MYTNMMARYSALLAVAGAGVFAVILAYLLWDDIFRAFSYSRSLVRMVKDASWIVLGLTVVSGGVSVVLALQVIRDDVARIRRSLGELNSESTPTPHNPHTFPRYSAPESTNQEANQ